MSIIFKGNERFAYRDPACFYYGGKYALFFHGYRADSSHETHGAATLAVVYTDDFISFRDEV